VSARAALLGTGLALALALGAGACGGGGSDQPAYCQDRAALQQSLNDLRGFDVSKQGLDELQSQLTQVERDANALADSAQEQFGPQARALRSSVDQLASSAKRATTAPSTQAVSDLATDASAVVSAFGELSDAISSSC
jgi:uncharacterized protein HemX